MCLSIQMTAQSQWESVLEQKSSRSFAAAVYQNSTDMNMNLCVDVDGVSTALLAGAIAKGANGIVDYILRSEKVDLSLICNDMTILQYGIKYGDAELVQDLLKAGADPSQLSESGKSAMHTALKNDKPVVLGYLKALQR